MIRFSKIFLCLTTVLLLLWQLPWCYSFFTPHASRSPFTLYSSLTGDFISIGHEEGKGIVRHSPSGRLYTQEEADSLLPFFYMRQLIADDRFPDSIHGIAITPREVQNSNFSFRTSASDINAPQIALYPLLESLSGRVDLTMPDDVFRLTDNGIEFIRMKENQVDNRKSRLFTEAMSKKGFRFPTRCLSGNPTTRKDYDEGYLIADREGKLFHLKQVKGRPYVRAIPLPEGLHIRHLFITEFKDRKTLGYLTDSEHHFYVLRNKSYEVIRTGIPSYNPEEDMMTIIGNLFDWTICIKTDKADTYYALNANDYSLIKSLRIPVQNDIQLPWLHFTSPKDKYVKPRF